MTSTSRATCALAAVAACAFCLLPTPVLAQSVTEGRLSGVVRDARGQALADVSVQLVHDEAVRYATATTRTGRYDMRFVDPGRYTVRVERLGYRPVHVTGVPVLPARQLALPVELAPLLEGDVTADSVAFADAIAQASRPGTSRLFGPLERRLAAPHEHGADDLLRLSSVAQPGLEIEGLPARYSALVVDGVAFRPAEPAYLLPGRSGSALLPLEAAAQPELLAGRLSMEWPALAGGLLSAMSERGAAGFAGRAYGSYGPSGLVLEDVAAGDELGSWRAGAALGGSLASDSAHFRVFGHASRTTGPAAAQQPDSLTSDALQTAYGLDPAALSPFEATSARRFNGGARFDWRFSQDQELEVGALYGAIERDALPRLALPGEQPGTLEGTDFMATAAVRSRIADRASAALRFGIASSTRELVAQSAPALAGLPQGASLVLSDAAFGIGTSPLAGGQAGRTDFTGQSTLHVQFGAHELSAGVGGRLSRFDRQSPLAQSGIVTFGGPQDVIESRGAFFQSVGPVPSAEFSTRELFGFAQDSWRVAPGLDLITGVRGELEMLPDDEIVRDADWHDLTGIDNTAATGSVGALGAMLGFDWNVGERYDWLLRGALTLTPGDIAPDLLAEAITLDGRRSVRRGLGDVGADAEALPTFRTLTLLRGDVRAPRTTRASLGLARAFGDETTLLLAGVLRNTQNLPRRADLNLPVQPAAVDQHGRPVHGRLERVGGIIAAAPGSNRRFPDYDIVSAITTDAESRYWGVTAAMERRATRWLDLAASYTYSETTDDVGIGAVSAAGALNPFAGDEALSGWGEDVSDLDRPHRFAAAAQLKLPLLAELRIGASYRYESGAPFTPGLPAGVDLNGDGVAGNDPAFIDAAIQGVPEAAREWGCLGEHNGEFVERNACRLPARQGLDLRVEVGLTNRPGFAADLLIEALDVFARGGGWYDTALYRVDPQAPADLDAADGVIVAPLIANPRFGERIIEPPTPGLIRAGVQVRF